jgi:hypothetical protein
MLKTHADSQIGFAVSGLDSCGAGPGRIGEIAVEEDCSEDDEGENEWEKVVH